jgi:hypothetical protein
LVRKLAKLKSNSNIAHSKAQSIGVVLFHTYLTTHQSKNMQLNYKPMTIKRYLKHYDYTPIIDNGQNLLVQLKNLKLVQIELGENSGCTLQEVTQGKQGELWEDISVETAIKHIQMLEGSNDSFSKVWHINDVLAIDSTLSQNHARLVLQMAIDNHDFAVGINTKVLTKYIRQVLKMKADGII